jgi:hypothetical protein
MYIEILNEENDLTGSLILDELYGYLSSSEEVDKVIERKTEVESKKCVITAALTFSASVGASILGAALYDVIKNIYKKHRNNNHSTKICVITPEQTVNLLLSCNDSSTEITMEIKKV